MLLTGCASVPPHRVAVDRMGYGEVIADSWKRQTLLNVVRLRYADAPVFLDVASVINSYSVAGKTSASAQLPEGVAPNVFSLGAEGSWSNTPTVTYQPLLGDRFTRSMLALTRWSRRWPASSAPATWASASTRARTVAALSSSCAAPRPTRPRPEMLAS
jgi:hypothetical protein